jgi:peptide chain release factor subunit 1
MNEEEIFKLKKVVKELDAIRGRHTELVSVYVPAGGNLQDTIDTIKNEQSTASNIKSKATRKNVVDALEKIVQHLRTFRKTPENGLAVFCGNVSENEGKPELRIWSIQPPIEMKQKLYWCDQVFVLDPLKEMVKEKDVYGLILMDSKECEIGLLSGKRIIPVLHLDSAVPGKTTKGGYSQMRYQHVRVALLNDFMKEIAENATKVFNDHPEIKGIIVGGPGPNKDSFMKNDYLTAAVRNKVIGIRDTGYMGEYGLEELVSRSQDLLSQASLIREREILENFFTELKRDGKVVYGMEKTERALDSGAVELLLISEGFSLWRANLRCQSGHEKESDMIEFDLDKQICDICGTRMQVQEKKELMEIMTEKAVSFGAKVELISTDSREGKQFRDIGGIGAILRYKI